MIHIRVYLILEDFEGISEGRREFQGDAYGQAYDTVPKKHNFSSYFLENRKIIISPEIKYLGKFVGFCKNFPRLLCIF